MNLNSVLLKFSTWRSFATAAWLGWKIESNWTDPFLFAVYSIVKPLAGASILVVMYSVITQGDYTSPVFAYIFIGGCFYQYVAAVMTGVSWAVIDDREHYRTLKYIYTAPVRPPFYLMGRAVARFITASFAVLITLLVGVLFLHLPLDLAHVNWLNFTLGMILGVSMLAMMGLLLAGITMNLARHSDYLGEAVAGALYLFSGAIFPMDVLPAFLRPVGYAMPMLYWLELVRRSLVPQVAGVYPTLAGVSDGQLILILLGLTILFGVVGFGTYRWFDQHARENGMIDKVTNY
ncbi:MAG TPA: ABC transporter permease [Anaerolineaceae bacterium]